MQWTWQKTQAFGLQVKSKAEADNIVSLLKKAQAGELKQKGPAEDLNSLRDAKDYQVVPQTKKKELSKLYRTKSTHLFPLAETTSGSQKNRVD